MIPLRGDVPTGLEDPMSETTWRPWLPEGIAVLMVLGVGCVEAVLALAMIGGRPAALAQVPQAFLVAIAVGMCRRAPGPALVGVWGLGLLHVASGAPIMLVEFALTAVFFGCARWGSPPAVVTSALSVPLAVVVAFVLHEGRIISLHLLLGGSRLVELVGREPAALVTVVLVGVLVVAAPWPAGLVMRLLDREKASRASVVAAEEAAAGARRETEHAREIAQLRDQQTHLALDVHDVVGHSLAVILAQAESGQYLDDTATLKKTLATIATSARSSLRDVRQVLSSTQDRTVAPEDPDRFDNLIDGVRGSGHEIVATESGLPRRLPRETAMVTHRVFQEMLTNAIKHGRRDQPITVGRHWPTGDGELLLIEVTNTTDASGGAGTGRGLDGMRRRLETVGGHLDVRRQEETFTVTAFVPVRDSPHE
jgi:signal transduction histidine kinase